MALKFVPEAAEICEKSLRKFSLLVGSVEKLLVITGAGISTESGIPDYRSKDVGLYATMSSKPLYYHEFMRSSACRQRYWARHFLSWPTTSQAVPNINHHTLAKWETSERFLWLITQNIDGLHVKAGSSNVTELHGNSRYVKCTNCDYTEARQSYQKKMEKANEGFSDLHMDLVPSEVTELRAGLEKSFNVPGCPCCGGIMKTDVTFFGETLSMDKLNFAGEKVEECDGILAIGTSLAVIPGSRLVHHAHSQKKPIFIVNIGPTCVDHMATMKMDNKISDVLKMM